MQKKGPRSNANAKRIKYGFRECICRRVTPDYAADLSVPILDRGQKAKRKGDRLLFDVQCTYVDLIIKIKGS